MIEAGRHGQRINTGLPYNAKAAAKRWLPLIGPPTPTKALRSAAPACRLAHMLLPNNAAAKCCLPAAHVIGCQQRLPGCSWLHRLPAGTAHSHKAVAQEPDNQAAQRAARQDERETVVDTLHVQPQRGLESGTHNLVLRQ